MGNMCSSVKNNKNKPAAERKDKVASTPASGQDIKEKLSSRKENQSGVVMNKEGQVVTLSPKEGKTEINDKNINPNNININIDVKIINQGGQTHTVQQIQTIQTKNHAISNEKNINESNKFQSSGNLPQTHTSERRNKEDIVIDSNVFVSKASGNPFEHYSKEKKLGEGSFGTVYLVKHKILTSTFRAMKELKKNTRDISKETETEIMNEINILKKLDHPNIVKLFEFYNQPDSFYLVTEYCKEGELFKHIVDKGKFDEGFTAYVMYQIFTAVNYCHGMGIIHRDLKPENILIESKERNDYLRVKVIDFGTAQLYEKGKVQRKVIGSAYYIAPEVLMKNYNEKCDLWSCGVIMYILLSGRPPFGGNSDSEIVKCIRVGTYDLTSYPFNKISPEAKNLITSLLTRDPSKRISADEALNHVWFKKLKTKEKLNELVKNNKFKFINNLKNYRTDKVLQSAALAYLVHNFNQMEDVREANKLFNSIDVNGDGKITKIELLTGLKKVLNINDDSLEEDVDKIFKNIDADNNGYIEFEEFVRGCIDKEKLLSEDVLKFAFRYFDKDGSGEITREEIKEIFFANVKKNDNVNLEQQLEYIISEVDINGDGKISIDEFAHMMKNMIN